jgi:hypothetical protein
MFLNRCFRACRETPARRVRCAQMTQKLYVEAGDNVDEMNLRCCEGSEHERHA